MTNRWNLFLDDIRNPRDPEVGWTICRSGEQAQAEILKKGCPALISFDHDLGEGITGYALALWLIQEAEDGTLTIPSDFQFRVHSANPVGVKNIRDLLTRYLEQREI